MNAEKNGGANIVPAPEETAVPEAVSPMHAEERAAIAYEDAQTADTEILADDGEVAVDGVAAAAMPDTEGATPARNAEYWTPAKVQLAAWMLKDPTVRNIAKGMASKYIGGDADDLIQATILRLAKSDREFDSDASPYGLITNTMRWVISDTFRHASLKDSNDPSRRRIAEVPAVLPDDETPGFWGITPDAAKEAIGRVTLRNALASLSEDHRRVLVDIYLNAMSLAAVAEMRGVPYGTVKSRLHYATKALRAALPRDDI